MSRYDRFSREELIRRIEELEAGASVASASDGKKSAGWFRKKYSDKILDSIPDMLTVFAADGTIVDLVSTVETNHSGVEVDALVGKTLDDLLTPQNACNVRKNLENVFTSGRWSRSHHNITLDGRTSYYENRIFPLNSEHALCMCRDITTEEEARAELEMVKYAMNNVDEEIYASTVDGTMIYANQRFRRRNKLEGRLSHRRIYEFWLPQGNKKLWQERVAQIREGGGMLKYTVRFKNEQGSIMAWDILANIVYDEYREREVIWFFSHDVTMQILHESKLKEMNILMNSILNNIPVYLFVKDPGNEFRYLYWNRAFEEYSKVPASAALGHTDFEIFPNVHDAEKFRMDDLRVLRDGERVEYEEQYVSPTGEVRTVSTSKALVSMGNRMPLIIGVSWDITDRKRVEKEVVEARIRAEESDRLKSAFLANMSHEIRTPLNAIVGFSKLVAEADNEEEQQQYADIIDSNAELLLQLINDILDISKIEAGTLDFQYRPMELNELCRSEYEIFRTRVPEGVTLVFDDRSGSQEIICDQNRLAQVITNLLTNAAKFTSRGEIRFGYDLRGGWINFYVRDTGVGIAADKLERIFDRFVKLNNFAVGTGLGLAITKMIIEKMGGTISVESEEGNGSCFRFSVPIEQD